MQPGSFWICPLCGGRNKAYAAVCLSCGRGARSQASRVETSSGSTWEPLGLTRGAPRWALAAGVMTAGIVALLIVRTFRSPALDAAERAPADTAAVAARNEPDAPPISPAPPAMDTPPSAEPPPTYSPPLASPPARGYAPSEPPLPGPGHVYTDAHLRAYAEASGRPDAGGARYRLALRQRRVDDLRARLLTAGAVEREKLEGWLRSAEEDLAEAEREVAARGR